MLKSIIFAKDIGAMHRIIFVLTLFSLLFAAPVRASRDRKTVPLENGLVSAMCQIENGDLAGARARLTALDRQFPDNDAVNFFLGVLEIASKDDKQAIAYMEKAVRLDSTNTDYLDALANLYLAAGQSGRSSSIFLKLLERYPQKYANPYTLTLLGDRQTEQRKDSAALASYEKALMYDAGYVPALFGKMEAHRRQGQFLDFFSTATPLMRDTYLNPAAKTSYIRALLEHVDGRFYQVWGGQLDSLVEACVQTHPSDSSTLRLAGSWYYGTGRKEKGEKYFDRYLAAWPDLAEPHYIQVQLLAERSDWEGVIRTCRDIIRICGKDKKKALAAYSTIGDSYYNLGDRKNAYAAYEKALKIDPGYVPVLNNYAYYLSLESKNLAKAEKMSRITIEKEPDNATYLDTYGWILHLCGRSKQAKPYFKHAMLYGGKDSAVILEHFSLVLEALGEKDLAAYYRGLAESKKQ